jgi:hypothetical protein
MKRRIWMFGAGVLALIGLLGEVPAAAAPEGAAPVAEVESVPALIEEVAGPSGASATKSEEGIASLGSPVETTVSTDADAGAEIEAADGRTVTVAPVGIEEAGAVSGDAVVYGDGGTGSSTAIRPTPEGAQALIVIDGPGSASEFAFEIAVDGEPAELELVDGAVEVRSVGSAEPSATVLPPWAVGADGVSVPTRFKVRGDEVVQVVDHRGAAYPVVADPNTCGWVTCTYYFGRRATKDIAKLPTLAGPVCAATAFIHPGVAVGCAFYVGAIIYQADRAADRRGYCLKIKYPRVQPPGVPVLAPQIYSGGHCR